MFLFENKIVCVCSHIQTCHLNTHASHAILQHRYTAGTYSWTTELHILNKYLCKYNIWRNTVMVTSHNYELTLRDPHKFIWVPCDPKYNINLNFTHSFNKNCVTALKISTTSRLAVFSDVKLLVGRVITVNNTTRTPPAASTTYADIPHPDNISTSH